MATIWERLTQLHTEDTVRERLETRFVRVDGAIVTDPDTVVSDTAKIVLQPPPES